MNPFDSLQHRAFATVASTMGYDATWHPAEGGEIQTAKVLYKGPTEKEKLLSADFDPERVVMEYQEGDLPGLFEIVRGSKNKVEVISLDGLGEFYVKSVRKLWDGKTYEAPLKFKS